MPCCLRKVQHLGNHVARQYIDSGRKELEQRKLIKLAQLLSSGHQLQEMALLLAGDAEVNIMGPLDEVHELMRQMDDSTMAVAEENEDV